MTRQAERTALQIGQVRLRFEKQHLRPAREFYQAELGELGRENRKGWAIPKTGCPFHESRSKTSFAVNLRSGGFYCHGCGASGGDIIDFLMLRDSISFKEACQQLGCWDEDAKPVKVRPGPPVRYLVLDFNIDGIEYREEVRDEPRTELQLDRRFNAAAQDRLAELRHGDAERFEGEEETQWGILAASWQLIQMEVARGD